MAEERLRALGADPARAAILAVAPGAPLHDPRDRSDARLVRDKGAPRR